MFKLFKKNYYRITAQDLLLRSYYIIKAKSVADAEFKFRKNYSNLYQIISIEKVEENEIE